MNEEYLETYFEVVYEITRQLDSNSNNLVNKIHSKEGRGGLWNLAKQLTDKFYTKYRGVLWGIDLEYFEELEDFLKQELK